jgi:DNA polymerase-3 subunit delta'
VTGPAAPVLAGIRGQDRAVAQLDAAVPSPVHAYLLVGPPGSGKLAAAHAFAAALLCPNGGCGTCDVCRRARAGVHPDLIVVEREGAFITVGQAREIQRLALRTPNEGPRKVLVLTEFHLAREAAGTLLKIVEEPPPSTIFVILADHVTPELVTIASRCVRVDFSPLNATELTAILVGEGVNPEVAAHVAEASGGRLDRARLLASDPGFEARRQAWRGVPRRLDSTGATVAVIAAELVELLSSAAQAPLEARHAAERAALAERIERGGARGAGRKELNERQRRELRRVRTDELRFGLATLAAAYRDALVAGGSDPKACLEGIAAIQAAAEALQRNPNELLLLQALLVRLPAGAMMPVGGGPES